MPPFCGADLPLLSGRGTEMRSESALYRLLWLRKELSRNLLRPVSNTVGPSRDASEGGEVPPPPPPPRRPAYAQPVSLTPSARLNGICNRQ